MTLSEQLMYIRHLLMKHYRVGPDIAMDAVQQAFSEIYAKQDDNYYGLWYTAAKRRLIDYMRLKNKERGLNEWELPSSYQTQSSEFEQIHEQLKKRLPDDDYAFFERMRAGQPITAIAEDMGVSEVTAHEYKKRMIRRCRRILAPDYPVSGWDPITSDKPDTEKYVEVLLPDGSSRQGYRTGDRRWVDAGGNLIANPQKYRFV